MLSRLDSALPSTSKALGRLSLEEGVLRHMSEKSVLVFIHTWSYSQG